MKFYEKVGPQEYGVLIMMMLLARLVCIDAHTLGDEVGQLSWILPLAGGIFGLGIYFLVIKLAKRKGEIVEAVCQSTNAPMSTLLILLLIAGIMLTTGAFMTEHVSSIKYFNFLVMDQQTVFILYMIPTAIVALFGLTAAGRCAKFILPILLLAMIAAVLLNLPNVETYRLYPLMGKGMGNAMKNVFPTLTAFWPVLLLAVFMPHILYSKKTVRRGIQSIGASAILGTILYGTLLTIVVPVAYQYIPFPFFSATTFIDGGVLQGLQPAFIFGISTSVILSCGTALFSCTYLFCRITNIEDHRPVAILMSVILFCLCLVYNDARISIETKNLMEKISCGLIYLSFLILFILVMRKGRKHDEKAD